LINYQQTKPHSKRNIHDTEENPKAVDRFTIIIRTLSNKLEIDDEVYYSIAKTSSAFSRLRHIVWENRGIAT
jgi:hypothetical protein